MGGVASSIEGETGIGEDEGGRESPGADVVPVSSKGAPMVLVGG